MTPSMKPYYEHAGITIYHGDCRTEASMSDCHWCDEGRPFMPGCEGKQHVPIDGSEHGSAMCYNSPIYDRLPKCPQCGRTATYQTPDGTFWDAMAHYWRAQ